MAHLLALAVAPGIKSSRSRDTVSTPAESRCRVCRDPATMGFP